MYQKYRKILITGAGGGIGNSLTKYLLENTDYNLTLSYYSKTEIPNYIEQYKERIKIVLGDISQKNILDVLFEDIYTIIHLASSVNPGGFNQDWNTAYKFGADSTFAILDYIKTYNNKIHLIFPSSGGTVYSENKNTPYVEKDITMGVSPYGIQKIMFENYISLLTDQNKNISCNILRISNPYGLSLNHNRKQGFIDITIQKVLNNEIIELWSPENTIRDYIYIDDLCEAFLRAINYQHGLEIFNIGSGIGYSLRDIIKSIEDILNKKITYEHITSNFYYPKYNVLNNEKAKIILNWEPKTKINTGLKKIISSCKEKTKCLTKI